MSCATLVKLLDNVQQYFQREHGLGSALKTVTLLEGVLAVTISTLPCPVCFQSDVYRVIAFRGEERVGLLCLLRPGEFAAAATSPYTTANQEQDEDEAANKDVWPPAEYHLLVLCLLLLL